MKPPANLMILTHTAALSGNELFWLRMIPRLDRNRYRPIVLLGESGPLEARLQKAGCEIHVHTLPERILHTRKDSLGIQTALGTRALWEASRYVNSLATLMRSMNIRIVHTTSQKMNLLGGLAARRAKIPLVWTINDRLAVDYMPRVAVLGMRWLSRVLPRHVIAASQAVHHTLHLPSHLPQSVIYCGVDGGQFPDHLFAPAKKTAKAGHIPTIALIGRIAPWKGQHVFLEAARLILPHHPRTQFKIIGSPLFGEDDYLTFLREKAHELELGSAVSFLGFRSDIPTLLRDIDILVHASTTPEPFGQVIVEGMMGGAAVVATAAGGPLEIIDHGKNGLLVSPGDAKSLADAVLSLLSNPVWSRDLADAGRRKAFAHFSLDQTSRQLHEVYQRITDAQ